MSLPFMVCKQVSGLSSVRSRTEVIVMREKEEKCTVERGPDRKPRKSVVERAKVKKVRQAGREEGWKEGEGMHRGR